jgi:hypothetical protein
MDQILLILLHTPLWVYAVFAVLMIFGLQGLRARSLPVWRVAIVPAFFILWGVISVISRSAAFPIGFVDWLITGAAGFAIAWLTTGRDSVEIDRVRRQVRLPGSVVPLTRNLLIFFAKYALTAAMAVAPAHQVTLLPFDIGVSGLSAGYFIGWLLLLALKFREGSRQAAPFAR